MFQLRIDTVTVVKEISQISVVNKYSKALMLPPVFFSTASRTEKQSAMAKRTLLIDGDLPHMVICVVKSEFAGARRHM